MANPNRFCYDDETGEILAYLINDETGEAFFENTFPSKCLETKLKRRRKSIKFPSGRLARTKKFQTLKANIIAGSNKTSHWMFLMIPTLMFFPNIFCVMLMLLEIYLHFRCHKKNKTLNDPNLYYRSPFHMITSTFCGVCRDCDMASKIGQLQDKRRYHYDYIRGMAI